VRVPLQHPIFLGVTSAKYDSCRNYCKFRRKFHDAPVQTIQFTNDVRFRVTGSNLDSTITLRREIVTEGKLKEIHASLKISPRKSLARLAQKRGMSASFAKNTRNPAAFASIVAPKQWLLSSMTHIVNKTEFCELAS